MSLLSNGITLIHLDSVMRLTNNYQLLEKIKLRKIYSPELEVSAALSATMIYLNVKNHDSKSKPPKSFAML